jgi:hypothetical protein
MKKLSIIIVFTMLFLALNPCLNAQGPKGKSFGFGLILGDPTGLTINYFTNSENSWDAYIGSSYFGSLRIGGDYLWHFNAFNSNVVKMYAGPGIVLGFGNGTGIWYKEDHDKFYYWKDNSFGMGARVIFGANIIPRNTPIEIFFELGPLVGFSPNVGVNIDAALGIRFYP